MFNKPISTLGGVQLPPIVRTVVPIIAFFIGLQAFAMSTPPFIMPSVVDIGARYLAIWVTNPDAVVSTFLRIVIGLSLAFVVGTTSGMAMGMSPVTREYGETFVKFLTGIPGLSWVLSAVVQQRGVPDCVRPVHGAVSVVYSEYDGCCTRHPSGLQRYGKIVPIYSE